MKLYPFRDCKAWLDYGYKFSSTSNEAVKLFDATLLQYVGWYDEPGVGGMEKCVENMLRADETFVMGQVLSCGLDALGTGRSPRLDAAYRQELSDLQKLAQKPEVEDWEKKHVKAIVLFAEGYQAKAVQLWEDLLTDNPLDMLALKFAHDSYFYLGQQAQMRDSLARVRGYWKDEMPLQSYLDGMHSFGLVETNFYQESKRMARRGLDRNPNDAWATHSMAHALEMMGQQDDGIAFMSKTVCDWEVCNYLAAHNFWHWAVYHIEKGEYAGALDIFDSEIGKRLKSGAMLDIVDATSLLYRLQLEGVSVGDRWDDVYEICRPHADDHLLIFNDAHLLMSYLGAGQTDQAQAMIKSLEQWISASAEDVTQARIAKEVGSRLLRSLSHYAAGEYSQATDLLAPVKYRVLNIGGSNAQRDVFSQFLIHCALKSDLPEHKRLARHLLAERKCMKEKAPLTDRLMAKAMAEHSD